jgi:hypothetical protein
MAAEGGTEALKVYSNTKFVSQSGPVKDLRRRGSSPAFLISMRSFRVAPPLVIEFVRVLAYDP